MIIALKALVQAGASFYFTSRLSAGAVARPHCESILADLIIRRDVIRAIKVSFVYLLARNKRVDFDGVGALDGNRVEFFVVDKDISILRIFVAASLVRVVDWLARDLVDKLLTQAVDRGVC